MGLAGLAGPRGIASFCGRHCIEPVVANSGGRDMVLLLCECHKLNAAQLVALPLKVPREGASTQPDAGGTT